MGSWVDQIKNLLDAIETIRKWFEGKKTYISAFLIALCKILEQVFGITIPPEVYQWLGITTVVMMAAKINRSIKSK